MSNPRNEVHVPRPATADLAADRGSMAVVGVAAGYRRGPDVIHDVSFEVGRSEVVAILGRNGAGKTTLLRTLSGLLKPRRGEITLDGRPLSLQAPHAIARTGLGHVPEGRRVFQGMTVLDNLRLGGHTVRPTRRAADRLGEIFEILPCSPDGGRALPERSAVENSSCSPSAGHSWPIHRCSCSTSPSRVCRPPCAATSSKHSRMCERRGDRW